MLALWEAGASIGIYVGAAAARVLLSLVYVQCLLALSFVKNNIWKTEIISLVSWQVSSKRCVSTAVLHKGKKRDECLLVLHENYGILHTFDTVLLFASDISTYQFR